MKINKKINTTMSLAAAMGSLALAGSASAALVQVNTDGANVASGTDLLQTSQDGVAILTGTWDNETTAGVPGALYDGVIGPYRRNWPAPSNNAIVTFTLDTSVNTLGYDLTGMDFYHGWSDDGRDGFRFTIEISTVGDAGFTTYDSTAYFDPASSSGRTGVTDSTGTIASGVDQIRITPFEIENTYGGLQEIDVFGTATVPEPSTTALLGLGGLALILRRRK